MTRFALTALMISLAVPALSAGTVAEECAATAAIVADAVTARAAGSDPSGAVEAVSSGDIDPKFQPLVQPLVDWVYTLPEEQLTDEASAAFEAACIEQSG